MVGNSRRSSVVWAALAWSAIAATPSMQVATFVERAPEMHWTRNRDFDVRHYTIEIEPRWTPRSLDGVVTITLRPFHDVDEIALDVEDTIVHAVTTSLGASPHGATLAFAVKDARLTVHLDRVYRRGEDVSIRITYTSTPTRGMRFIGDGVSADSQIWTIGQTHDNHHWFPSYDAPNDLATVETIVTVRHPYMAIANGVLQSVVTAPAGDVRQYRWKMEQPIAAYLISVVVGDFAELKQDGHPQIFTYVPRAGVANAHRSLGEAVDMMRFLVDYLGVPYPYVNYKQIVVREFPGGMENASATQLGEHTLYDERAAVDEAEPVRLLMAHELAHQWFGDLVTVRDWSDVWLHEGFATYLAHLYTHGGDDEMAYAMLVAQRRYLESWTEGNRRPLATRQYVSEDSLFDVLPYAKGTAVLHMLRFVLGEERWRAALRHFLEANAFDNVDTERLGDAVGRATGLNVDWFFDQWVSNAGHPEFTVSYRYDIRARAVTVAVEQGANAGGGSSRPRIFRTPVDIAVTTGRGERVHRVVVDRRAHRFTFDVDEMPLIVNFDRGGRIVKALRFEKGTEELAYQARHDRDAAGRIWAIGQLKARGGPLAHGTLRAALAEDPFWAARLEAARALADERTAGVMRSARAAMADVHPAVRREAVRLLARFDDAEIDHVLRTVVHADASDAVVREAVRALAARRAAGTFDLLAAMLDASPQRAVLRVAAVEGFAALKDGAAFDRVLPLADAGNPPALRAAAVRAAVAVGIDRDLPRARLRPVLEEALAGGPESVKLAALDGLEQLGDPAVIPALRAAALDPIATGPNDARLRSRLDAIIQRLHALRETAR